VHNIKRERPGCRKQILKLGIRPFIENGEWDGITTVRPNGDLSTVIGGMAKQMRLMAAEGHWPEVRLLRHRRRWPYYSVW
jgi:hypothetical protein